MKITLFVGVAVEVVVAADFILFAMQRHAVSRQRLSRDAVHEVSRRAEKPCVFLCRGGVVEDE